MRVRREAPAIFLTALAALTLLLHLSTPALAAEVIERFTSDIQVQPSGDLAVTETIRVRAEGDQIRRGIFRDFPLTFTDPDGNTRRVGFRLGEVTRNGRPEPHFERSSDDGVRIYVGAEDVLIPHGAHTYTISYLTTRQVRTFGGEPELYWNVTGNEWIFPIRVAEVHVRLPGGAEPSRWTAFTGPHGAQGQDFEGSVGEGGILTVRTTAPLDPYEGLTIVAGIPAEALEPPGLGQRLVWLWLDYKREGLLAFGLLAVGLYYLFMWDAVGRDPKPGIIIPRFYPPKRISPALASYVHERGWAEGGWRAFTAAALSLAVKGLVLFDEEGKMLRLKRTEKRRPGELPPGEAALLSWLEGERGEIVISKANGEEVKTGGTNFRKALERENRGRFFRTNLGHFIGGVVLTVLVLAVMVWLGGLGEEDIAILMPVGIASIVAGVFVVPAARSLFRGRSAMAIVKGLLGIVVGLMLIFVFAGSFLFAFGDIFPVLLAAGFAGLNGLFFYLLRAPTAAGRPVIDELEGFRLYMETAEKERLNMDQPDLTAERFESLLPYAVALDVERPWS
ncbi:MAG TPA: DUF2207 domain-containing protein, partial [Afifellaceae bacterium]|nr:DUF2207 domain-containing protein [Afifellaceae bacterium]